MAVSRAGQRLVTSRTNSRAAHSCGAPNNHYHVTRDVAGRAGNGRAPDTVDHFGHARHRLLSQHSPRRGSFRMDLWPPPMRCCGNAIISACWLFPIVTAEAIARVVQQVLDFTTKNPNADFEQIREIAQTEGTRVASNLNNRVTYLADIGMIAPLLGLLGTVIGIIRSFGALGADVGSQRYMQLSHGISEALFNTAAGLAIGIPAMIFYAFFRGRSQRLISELESAVTHILALLSLQFARRSERTPALLESEF